MPTAEHKSAHTHEPAAHAHTEVVVDVEARLAEAESIVKSNVLWSMGAGVVPVPVFDLIAISAVEVKLIRELSHLYGKTFMENKVKNIVAVLIGGLGAGYLGRMLFTSVLKTVPGLGTAAAILSVPASAGALTYGIGRVFIMHFESGGTLLDFDVGKMKHFFATKVAEGKTVAVKIKAEAV